MRYRKFGLLTVCLTLFISSCGAEGAPTTSVDAPTTAPPTTAPTDTAPLPTGTPVVMDTDMAGEGIMSILYLLGQDGLDIQAITVAGTGLVHCEAGIRQALGLVELADADPVPVACGSEDPVSGRNTFPASWRVAADEAYGLQLPQGGEPSALPAPELIVSVVMESPVPVVVYADGPLTNLAEALRLEPSLAGNVEMAYVMGGAFEVGGNTIRNPDAEWNIWVDPEAADAVLRSLPVTLVPLDATSQVPLNVFHLAALQQHQDTEMAKAVVTLLEGNESLTAGGLYFWDQLTAALIVDESYAAFSTENVAVALDDDRSAAGATRVIEDGTPIRVATAIDTARFETDFLSALAGTDVGPIVVEPDWEISFDGETWSTELPETGSIGEYSVRLVNDSDNEVLFAFGWLIEGGTVEDAEAWTSISQPPFLELAGTLYAAGETESVTIVAIDNPETYAFFGLDLTSGQAEMLGSIEVPG